MRIEVLAGKLRKDYRKTKSWNITGEHYKITGGMAYRIALQGYDPAQQNIRDRLKLDSRKCPKCGRRTLKKSDKPKLVKPDYMIAWGKLEVEERHKIIKEYLKYKDGKT